MLQSSRRATAASTEPLIFGIAESGCFPERPNAMALQRSRDFGSAERPAKPRCWAASVASTEPGLGISGEADTVRLRAI